MELLLPGGVAVASIGLTYVMCIRPMRRGHCAMMPEHGESGSNADEAEIAALRAEIAGLRHDSSGR